jgi:phage shock protein PspC (stress-responsive transcriptional regulator)
MKKVININFQGRVIPIEEPAYEELRKYIDSLREYFRNEEGRDEIINDIENRIAELFTAKLNKEGAGCITDSDLDAIITNIGRPEDFEKVEGEPGMESSNTRPAEESGRSTGPTPRGSFYRNTNDSILGGVCSGIAHYLRIDPTIVRLLFAIITFGGFGTGLLIYIVLWIVLPPGALKTNVKRRLFRDPDNKMVGGVAGGLSAYFNIDVWIPRLVFLSPILLGFLNSVIWWPAGIITIPFGGFIFLCYIILWIVVPLAITASEKLEMRGEKVDLESIRDTVREEMQGVKAKTMKAGEAMASKARELGGEASESASQMASGSAKAVRGAGIGRAIGMLFKIFFLFIASIVGFALLMALLAILVGASVLAPFQSFVLGGFWEQATAAGTILLFFALPLIAIITWLIRRITGVRSKNKYLGYAFTSLWVLGWVSVFAFISLMARHFEKRAELGEEININQPSSGSLELRLGKYPGRFETIGWADDDDDAPALSPNNDSLILNTVRIRIAKSPDSLYRLKVYKAARGSSVKEADQTAGKLSFEVQQVDSILYLPKGFAIAAADKFRNQQVILVVEVPVGKSIRVDGSTEWFDFFDLKGRKSGLQLNFSYQFDDQFFPFEYDRSYRMTNTGLERLDITPEERIEELKEELEEEFREFRKKNKNSKDSINISIDGKDTTINMDVDFSHLIVPETYREYPTVI